MKELIEVSLAVLSVVAILVGAARWLLSVYYKQEKDLYSIKQRLMDESISRLQLVVDTHSDKISMLSVSIQNIDKDLKYTNKHLNEIKVDLKEYMVKTDKYSSDIDKRMSVLEVLSDNLRVLRAPKK